MIAIRGAKSKIAQELLELLPCGEQVVEIGRGDAMLLDADRYLFCAGLLLGTNEPTAKQYEAALEANFEAVRWQCDRVIEGNPDARICVVGSESGFSGSFDIAYAQAKAALHRYVETKRLRTRDQQLVCIAPSIIADAGMTMRRTDGGTLIRKSQAHPKRRFLTSREVARAIHFALYVDEGYLSGVVVRLNGGQHTCTS